VSIDSSSSSEEDSLSSDEESVSPATPLFRKVAAGADSQGNRRAGHNLNFARGNSKSLSLVL
jgi:hypothetical protein